MEIGWYKLRKWVVVGNGSTTLLYALEGLMVMMVMVAIASPFHTVIVQKKY